MAIINKSISSTKVLALACAALLGLVTIMVLPSPKSIGKASFGAQTAHAEHPPESGSCDGCQCGECTCGQSCACGCSCSACSVGCSGLF